MTEGSKQPADSRLPHFLSVISANFAALSTAAIVLSVLASTIFLYSYLSVFDWRLIWIIEYGDILKVGLIACAIISSFAYFIYMPVQDAFDLSKKSTSSYWRVAVSLVLLFMSFAYYLWEDYTSLRPLWALHFHAHLAILLVLLATFNVIEIVRAFPLMIQLEQPPASSSLS